LTQKDGVTVRYRTLVVNLLNNGSVDLNEQDNLKGTELVQRLPGVKRVSRVSRYNDVEEAENTLFDKLTGIWPAFDQSLWVSWCPSDDFREVDVAEDRLRLGVGGDGVKFS
jgi:hypothetical protein